MGTNHMPSDIWGEILVRFPAESLFGFRAVSKGWRALIDDPCFIRAHTNNLEQLPPSSKVIIQNNVFHSHRTCYSLDLEALVGCSSGDDVTIAASPIDLDFIGDSPCGLSLSVSTCKGLVLTQEPSLTIWNPLTHERLHLPPPRFEEKVWNSLGYVAATHDYQAVAILRNRETHVYSIREDSWRRIIDFPLDLYPPDGPGVFARGRLFWLTTTETATEGVCGEKIVGLDLGTGQYGLLNMPKTRWNQKPGGVWLDVVLGGCLALCDSCFCSYLDVWVMKDEEEEDSWVKLFSVERPEREHDFSGFLRPVAIFVKEDKLLAFLQEKRDMFFLFDVETKSLKWVKIDGPIFGQGWGNYTIAQQMFVGTMFRLEPDCGLFRKRKTKKKNKRKMKKSADVELVFSIRDENEICSSDSYSSDSSY